MWGQADLQKLVQMLEFLGFSPSGASWTGGPTTSRPAEPQLYQLYFDTTLQQPVIASQITPTVIWTNSAGVPV